jgi:hypothetical protein
MSNATEHPLNKPLTIIRNGISATLTKFTGKRDAWKDRPYQAFQIETDGTEGRTAEDVKFVEGLDFIGKANVKNAINTILRRFGQDFVDDATGDVDTAKAGGLADGVFSLEKFVSFWEKLKSSAMRLSELQELQQSAIDEFTKYTTTTLMDEVSSGDPVRIANAKAHMERLNSTLISLKAEFEERKQRRSKEAATETAAAE